MIEEILRIMPRFIAEEIVHLNLNNSITEIRIRSKNKIIVICGKNEFVLDLIASPKIILDILLNVSKMSIYAIQTDLNNGFVVIRGGHRIGVCGEVVYENGKIKNIKNICSLNIRVAHQIFGCADTVMPQIIVNGIFQNTLIVSPPGCGKTTLLRDIIRLLSNGIKTLGFSGKNVSLIDERGEIASCYEGVPTLDIGIRTDVMSNIDKSTGMSMVIRSMAPDIIATDEIGSSDDVLSIKAAILSGVKVIFTMHGDSLKSVLENTNVKELIDMNVFSKIILLSSGKIPGIVEKIYDGGAYVTN
ncbi:MAG: stage III sporulation protein AA [Clostridia bacterium]|nr:stage III sporulation protein AA [Clostridia bacterium]